jgi:hypothetical protein
MAGLAATMTASQPEATRTASRSEIAKTAAVGLDASHPDTPAFAAMSRALAARGPDSASRRVGPMHLLVRAVIPIVYEPRGFAMVIDGLAEASAVAARYAQHGAAGLLPDPKGGRGTGEPYALILADPTRNTLLLARNGEGPPLYYAQTGQAVLVASEPTALLAAGIPAAPDPAVVDRFLATGACDDTETTFFACINRLLPGQVVEIGRNRKGDGPFRIRVREFGTSRGAAGTISGQQPVTAGLALQYAATHGRIGVRLGRGIAGAAILGTALARSDRPRPLAVYSTTFPGLPSNASEYASALLGPLGSSSVRHRALPFFADQLDLDGYLADLGEPTPDLAGYLMWAMARGNAGEVDALIDLAGAPLFGGAGGGSRAGAGQRLAAGALAGSAGAPPVGYLPRLADRVASRFGVALRFPFREMVASSAGLRADLTAVVDRTLPATVAHLAATPTAELATEPPLRELLAELRAELAAAFLHPRYPLATRALLADFQALLAERRVDAAALFRRYLVERWLRCVVAPAVAAPQLGAPVGRASVHGSAQTPAATPAPVSADRVSWARLPVRTEVITPGDKLTEKAAWYVAEFAAGLLADKPYRGALRQPWYVLIAAKPVAVAEGLARDVWEIRPGWPARLLSRLGGRRTGLGTPWAAQVAIEEGGALRTLAAAGCAAVGRIGWYERLASPRLRSVRGPREAAVAPAHVAVVPPPSQPDTVAIDLVAALRNALPAEEYVALAGCAVVGVDEWGCRLLGWGGRDRGAGTGPVPCPPEVIEALCVDNPFGQGGEQTPLVIAVRAPRKAAERPAVKPANRRAKPNAGKRR